MLEPVPAAFPSIHSTSLSKWGSELLFQGSVREIAEGLQQITLPLKRLAALLRQGRQCEDYGRTIENHQNGARSGQQDCQCIYSDMVFIFSEFIFSEFWFRGYLYSMSGLEGIYIIRIPVQRRLLSFREHLVVVG